MEKIIRLAVVVVLLYVGVTYGFPYLQELFQGSGSSSPGNGGSSGSGGGERCVESARQASATLGAEVRRFSPPVDPGMWSEAETRVRDRISEAQLECGCPQESCQKAGAALAELSHLLSELDGAYRGDSPLGGNPARRQERVDGLLDEARRLARSGN